MSANKETERAELHKTIWRIANDLRGSAEQKIRQYLIDNNYVDAVIQLPPDLFFGTTIATCIIVLKKSKRDNATLFIDASACFVRSGNKNKLNPEHQQKILDAFVARQNIAHFARLVDNGDIAKNGYQLSVSSYVEQEDSREAVDIRALNAEISRIVARQSELRAQIDALSPASVGLRPLSAGERACTKQPLLIEHLPRAFPYPQFGVQENPIPVQMLRSLLNTLLTSLEWTTDSQEKSSVFK